MPTASSTWTRLQALSQGWKHTRPMMAGKGFSSTSLRQAASYSPDSASKSQPWMFSPAGQALLHGGRRSR